MRIGVVTTSYPRWLGDHAGSFVEGHADALRDLGHEVEVIAAGDAETPRDRTAEQEEVQWRVELRERERRDRERRAADNQREIDLREGERRATERRRRPIIIVTANTVNGRPVIPDDDGRALRVPSRGLFYQGGAPEAFERSAWRAMMSAAAFLPRFTKTIAERARNWDHIIAHWLVPSALAARVTGKPITAIAHGGDIYTLRRFGLLKPTLLALRHSKLVFVSEELRRVAGVGGIVQPMGVDLDHFASIGRAPTSPPTVLFVGRLVPIKGVDTLIEAMAHLPGWRLVIAGDGPERRALEARARNASATFLGAVATGQRDRLLREASVVAVPSRTIAGRGEGCPTIALEALAAGVPVVATVGRASEIVRPDDSIGLARAIDRVAGQRDTAALVRDLDWIEVAKRLLRNE
jgi:glycosyltransferase involved in cell wall biosynthesis